MGEMFPGRERDGVDLDFVRGASRTMGYRRTTLCSKYASSSEVTKLGM